MKVKERYLVSLRENGEGVVKGRVALKLYSEGYGRREDSKLVLDPLEVAYFLFQDLARVEFKGLRVELEEFFSKMHKLDPMFWVKFTVYNDLKSRGRIVKPGFTSNSLLLYESKEKLSTAKKIVFVVEESSMFTLEELLEWVEIAARNDKESILAVVDRHGDVTYYLVNKFKPVDLGV